MARANTFAGTGSFTYFSLLKVQVSYFFNNAVQPSQSDRDMISKGLDMQYVHSIEAQGIDKDIIRAALKIEIDWRTLEITVKAGGEFVNVPKHWVKGVDPDLSEAVKAFSDFCDSYRLKREYSWEYNTAFSRKQVCDDLECGHGDPITRKRSEGLKKVKINNIVIPGVSYNLELDTGDDWSNIDDIW